MASARARNSSRLVRSASTACLRCVMSLLDPTTNSTAPPSPVTGEKMYSYTPATPAALVKAVSPVKLRLVSMTCWSSPCSFAASSGG